MSDFQILLYYKYVSVEDPQQLRDDQLELCRQLNLKGRIIVANEGINGTVEGTMQDTEQYVAQLTSDPRFADIHIKRSTGTGSAFPKLSVKARPELVAAHLGQDDVNPTQITVKRLSPQQLNDWLRSDTPPTIIDMRNDYEHQAGHFKNSILPPMHHFRQLPETLPAMNHLKNQPVVTVCTGGVRCEKASGYLLTQGFNDVYQLDGGIVSYMEAYPDQDFQGSLYVFDGRVVMDFSANPEQKQIIGKCANCQQASENFVNCANLSCHLHFICCQNCLVENQAYCGGDHCLEQATRHAEMM